jgi:hypothetical protein
VLYRAHGNCVNGSCTEAATLAQVKRNNKKKEKKRRRKERKKERKRDTTETNNTLLFSFFFFFKIKIYIINSFYNNSNI